MLHAARTVASVALASTWLAAGAATALEPPTAEQLERYRRDGSLERRAAAAATWGNHLVAPALAARLAPDAGRKALPDLPGVLPSTGNRLTFALLISFADQPGFTDPAVVDDALFGAGDPAGFPYESLRGFYLRSSYGLLDLDGATLGWYQAPYPRDQVEETTAGREALIVEAIRHFDDAGHDFARYDNDGDGAIDYFLVIWTGPHGEWAEFWWGYLTSVQSANTFRVDGKRLSLYSWQWEAWNWPGAFSPAVTIHETGHALGLPDYYDYDDAVGPRGGVGGLDQMAGNWGDHNGFSKWMLGWVDPTRIHASLHDVTVEPLDLEPDAVVVMHGDPPADPFREYFLVEHRRRGGNDTGFPADGLLIWHVDARTSPSGAFLYDNSYTEHKLLRLMEADGLEEIEQGGLADAGDFYRDGDLFGTDTTPSSHRYDGAPTNVELSEIETTAGGMAFEAWLGSGCAIFCDASMPETAWPGAPVPFEMSFSLEFCGGAAVTVAQDFGDGTPVGATDPRHVYRHPGTYDWSLDLTSGEAWCGRSGSILVCEDMRCWSWSEKAPMARGRYFHTLAGLRDGTALAVGDGSPERYLPSANAWSPTAPMNLRYVGLRAVALPDGRVLAAGPTLLGGTGAELYDPVLDRWSVTGGPLHGRVSGGLAVLADGRVLAAGGFAPTTGQPVLETELYDSATGAWSDGGPLSSGVDVATLTPLDDGGALLTGRTTAARFEPSTGSWRQLRDLAFERVYHAAVRLRDGRVMLLGGFETTWVMVFDPDTERWSIGGRLGSTRVAPTAVPLPTGEVLVIGGFDSQGTVLATSELWNPATATWSAAGTMGERRAAHAAALLPDGSILVGGGLRSVLDSLETTDSTERYAPPPAPPRHPAGRH